MKQLQPPGWAPARGYANGIAARGTQIFVGGQTDVDSMVNILENVPEKEAVAVRWIRRNCQNRAAKTETEKVAEANILSSEYGQKGLQFAKQSLNVSRRIHARRGAGANPVR